MMKSLSLQQYVFLTAILLLTAVFLLSLRITFNGEANGIFQTDEADDKNMTEIAPRYSRNYTKAIPFESFSYNYWQESKALPRALSVPEHMKIMDLIEQATDLLGSIGMEYFIIDGSLIGSYRNWDIVPWDDDFVKTKDILTSVDNFNRLVKVLQTQTSMPLLDWTMFYNRDMSFTYIKLFLRDTPYAGGQYWRFPFIDVFFYETNATHIWQQKNFRFTALFADVFPLQLRPVGRFWLPSPANPNAYLHAVGFPKFNEVCLKADYNHRKETKQRMVSVYCSRLKSDYPFVRRSCTQTQCVESLTLNGNLLKQIIFEL